MGLYNKLPETIEEVDIVIAGGGSAGCVVAGRLSEAAPDLSILLIESGPNNEGDPHVTYPAFFLNHMDPFGKYVKSYKSRKSIHLSGREPLVPTTRILGGGSSVNEMIYSRPQRSELDAWKMPGWSADELLPYMKKIETYDGPGSPAYHGYDGPMHVCRGLFRSSRLENDFITALGKVGWPEIEDINRLDTVNGAMRAVRYISRDGLRQDVAHQYLHSKLQSDKYPNLHVLVETNVERVLFDSNKRAVGVAYRPNPTFQPGTQHEPTRTVKARKLVVVSSGALGTPTMLERSGVGRANVLKRAGVPLVAEVPGVGENYRDHHIILYPYKTTLTPEETMDALTSGRVQSEKLIAENNPMLSWNAVDVQAKLRPTRADVASLGPDFEQAWDREFEGYPDKPMMIISPVGCYPGDPSGLPAGQYMGIATFSLHPFSRGFVHITGPNINDEPDLDVGFFADPKGLDVKKHIWMYKKQREILHRMEIFNGEIASGHPAFPAGSNAAIVEGPLSDVQNVEYTPEDDKAIEEWIRGHMSSCWQSMGTCKLAAFQDDGVVDANLSVYGVQGLKVADLSIPPSTVGSNTNNTAMTIGEKAADIILKELGISKE
ncbi:hypothetical protein SLS62_003551 [Diatrype stigma]|uniref:Glucose-methanol-choline oxidoreductase N-terminal domain-containing protein n=1 Tax=Diatrype stigma TaxID=117547 RepID=A0AAN9UW19_9PEZI